MHAGTRFTDIRSVVMRTALTVPFHEVCANRQPDCRRGSVGAGAGAVAYEQLLMPLDETHRLQALQSLALLDSEQEPDFDDVARLGSALFDVPTSLVSLIDRDRQWFKARVGLDAAGTPRDLSFCGHAILRDDVMVVPDASRDDRFHDNPLVTGAPFIRFYAGAPIRLPNGYVIGTVCLISPEPRETFGTEQRELLARLAGMALNAVAVRALRQEVDECRRANGRLARALEIAGRPVALLDPDGTLRSATAGVAGLCRAYPLPGASIFELTTLTPADLEPAAFGSDGERSASVRVGDLEHAVTLHRDPDGFVLLGEATAD